VQGEELIAAHPDLAEQIRAELKAAEFLIQARAGSSTGGCAESVHLQPDALPGYTITGEIQRGGQGVVVKAMQQATRREVAIKVLPNGPFVAPLDMRRFDQEVPSWRA